MIKLLQKICIGCLSMLLIFLLAGSGLQGAVLCYGEGGHIAIEPADSTCCSKILDDCSSHECSTDCTENEHSSDHDCGACVDISISIGFVTVTKESNRSDLTLPASGIIAPAAVDSLNFSEYLSVSELFIPSHFTPLRSIVLLI
jgi:hypothetical protein